MINLVLFTTFFKCGMPNILFVIVVRCSSMYEAYCLLLHGKKSKHFSNSKIEIMPKISKSANFR